MILLTFRPSKKLSGVICNAKSSRKNETEFGIPVCLPSLFNSNPLNLMLFISQCSSLACGKHILWQHCHVLLWMSAQHAEVRRTCISQMFRTGRGTSDERWRNDQLRDQLHDSEVSQRGRVEQCFWLRLVTLNSSPTLTVTKSHLQFETLDLMRAFIIAYSYTFTVILNI